MPSGRLKAPNTPFPVPAISGFRRLKCSLASAAQNASTHWQPRHCPELQRTRRNNVYLRKLKKLGETMVSARIWLARSSTVFTLTFALSSLAAAQNANWKDYRNNLAPYVAAPEHAVDKMLEAANLKPGETLYDLGCGDGRIVIAAAQRYKVKAVGIEISDSLAKAVAEKVKKEGQQKRVTIIHGDFMKTDLSQADVVTLYLATTENDTVSPNLERFLRPHA